MPLPDSSLLGYPPNRKAYLKRGSSARLSATSPIPELKDNVLRYAAAFVAELSGILSARRLLLRFEEENCHYAIPERRMGKNEATGAMGKPSSSFTEEISAGPEEETRLPIENRRDARRLLEAGLKERPGVSL